VILIFFEVVVSFSPAAAASRSSVRCVDNHLPPRRAAGNKRRAMGCGASVPAWETELTSSWPSMKMSITWSHWDDKPQKLKLTVADTDGVELIVLRGSMSEGESRLAGPEAIVTAEASGTTLTAQRDSVSNVWSLGSYARSGGNRAAQWQSSQESDGTLPKLISLNCSGGRLHVWRGEAPLYLSESPSIANKKRCDDLLGFLSSKGRIPKDADMGTYGFVHEVDLSVAPQFMQEVSKEKDQLALFLGILTDFFWSRGMDAVIPPPRKRAGGA